MDDGVSALGLCSWDRIIVTEAYPGPGEYAIVEQRLEQAGGTTSNTCAALSRLGVDVFFSSTVGDDDDGEALVRSLAEVGCDVSQIKRSQRARTDSGIIVVSGPLGRRDRTIFWMQGAKPELGDHLPIDDLLAREWFLVDVSDHRLRAFILDLPAHRSPRTRLLGTMTYLVDMKRHEGWEHALRHEILFGNERELRTLTGTASTAEAIAVARHDMLGNACRVIYLTLGVNGSIAIRSDDVAYAPAFAVDVVDTTGAGDAFAAGAIWGLHDRLDDTGIVARGNAAAALACRGLGARASQGDRVETLDFLTHARTLPSCPPS